MNTEFVTIIIITHIQTTVPNANIDTCNRALYIGRASPYVHLRQPKTIYITLT